MCLYENAQNLSPPCAQAISDVYVLREQYWTSYSDAQEMGHHHHHPAMGILVLGLFLLVLVKKIRHTNMPVSEYVYSRVSSFFAKRSATSEGYALLQAEASLC
jgi:hypothetical protein